MKDKRSVLIVLLMVVIVTVTPTCKSQTSKEQRVFDAETLAVDRPVAIPPEVLAILSKDSDVKRVLEAQSSTSASSQKTVSFPPVGLSRDLQRRSSI